ncbi:hypothetical protein [Chitinimonas lacunae]|uniref:DUF3616 domain-containing protein n=1 Tax=Chitinimonas lacunae TaxID=1963018 RepID=A0ABV8MWP4_9NEIS
MPRHRFLLPLTLTLAGAAVSAAPAADPLCSGAAECRSKTLWSGKGRSAARLVQVQFPRSDQFKGCEQPVGAAPETVTRLALIQAGKPAQWLKTVCYRGDAFSAVVKAHRLTLSHSGQRDNERWTRTETLSLPELRLLATIERNTRPFGVNAVEEGTEWDQRALQGRQQTRLPKTAGGNADALLIPALRDIKGYNWRRHLLGTCALTVDAGGRRGFVLQGKPTRPNSAQLKLLRLGSQGLVVEIGDDIWVRPGANPASGDHLQLWFASAALGANPTVQQKVDRSVIGWAIDPFTGQTRLLAGSATVPPKAQSVPIDAGRRRRLYIELPPTERLTVAYADNDDGRQVARLVSSSQLDPNRAHTLGSAINADPNAKEAGCVVNGDYLDNRFPAGLPLPLQDKD